MQTTSFPTLLVTQVRTHALARSTQLLKVTMPTPKCTYRLYIDVVAGAVFLLSINLNRILTGWLLIINLNFILKL